MDSIFNEILELYGIDEVTRLINLPCLLFENIEDEKEFEKLLLFFDESLNDVDNNDDLIEFEIFSENSTQQNLTAQQKQMLLLVQQRVKNMNLTPEKIDSLRQKQLHVNQQIQAEIYRNVNNSNDYFINAAKNPRAFMQQNMNSMQTIPKNMRQQIVVPPQDQSKKGIFNSLKTFYGKFMRVSGIMAMISGAGMLLTGTPGFGGTVSRRAIQTENGVIEQSITIPFNLLSNIIYWVSQCIDFVTGGITNLSSQMYVQKSESGMVFANGGVIMYYISMTLTLIFMIIPMCKNIIKTVKNSKKEEYAQTHQMIREDITDEMLYKDNKEYYEEIKILDEILEKDFDNLSVLNEGLFDWIKRILPTPKNLLKLVNKGFIVLVRTARGIEEGLKTGAISPFMAQFYNIVISIGNIILTIVKGILLIIAGLSGTDIKKVEAEHTVKKEAIRNGSED